MARGVIESGCEECGGDLFPIKGRSGAWYCPDCRMEYEETASSVPDWLRNLVLVAVAIALVFFVSQHIGNVNLTFSRELPQLGRVWEEVQTWGEQSLFEPKQATPFLVVRSSPLPEGTRGEVVASSPTAGPMAFPTLIRQPEPAITLQLSPTPEPYYTETPYPTLTPLPFEERYCWTTEYQTVGVGSFVEAQQELVGWHRYYLGQDPPPGWVDGKLAGASFYVEKCGKSLDFVRAELQKLQLKSRPTVPPAVAASHNPVSEETLAVLVGEYSSRTGISTWGKLTAEVSPGVFSAVYGSLTFPAVHLPGRKVGCAFAHDIPGRLTWSCPGQSGQSQSRPTAVATSVPTAALAITYSWPEVYGLTRSGSYEEASQVLIGWYKNYLGVLPPPGWVAGRISESHSRGYNLTFARDELIRQVQASKPTAQPEAVAVAEKELADAVGRHQPTTGESTWGRLTAEVSPGVFSAVYGSLTFPAVYLPGKKVGCAFALSAPRLLNWDCP